MIVGSPSFRSGRLGKRNQGYRPGRWCLFKGGKWDGILTSDDFAFPHLSGCLGDYFTAIYFVWNFLVEIFRPRVEELGKNERHSGRIWGFFLCIFPALGLGIFTAGRERAWTQWVECGHRGRGCEDIYLCSQRGRVSQGAEFL